MSITIRTAMTEQEARAAIAAIHTERLDAFRAAVPGKRTSDLLAYCVDAESVLDAVLVEGFDDKNEELIVAAAMLAVADEIDRRIPVPS